MNRMTVVTEMFDAVEEQLKPDIPLVSIVVPAYNEAAIIKENLGTICEYMKSLEHEYRWEMIVVDDGSDDETGELAEEFSSSRENVRVLRHVINFRVGQALKYAFDYCRGRYIVTMDVDLSYSPDHIGKLLATIRETRAKIVLASPYMKGGKVSNVPFRRRIMSIWANRLLSLAANGKLRTLTGMVRAYDSNFLKALNLRAMDFEINPEIIYKAQLLRAMVVEIPAHLDWSVQESGVGKRRSSMRILRGIMSCLFSAFMFRPFMLFILPGLVLLTTAFYPIMWAFIHTFAHYQNIHPSSGSIDYRFSDAVAAAFTQSPHAFLVGGISLMVAIQLITLGILSLQSKRYFEELFHLSTMMYRCNREDE